MRALVATFALLMLVPVPDVSALRRRRAPTHQGAGGASLRKRLHINSLITQEGTAEVETGGALSLGGDLAGAFSLPTVLKYTPPSSSTEFNVSFDSLVDDLEATHFSDRVTLGLTHEFAPWHGLSLAAGPQVSLFTRGESGARLGAVALARASLPGQIDGGLTATYSQATHNSATNPAGLLDLGGGFGRQLRPHITAHANYLYEKATGYAPQHSLYEGVEFQFTPRVALDLSVQQVGVGSAALDHQFVAGLTINLGPPTHWLRRRH